MDGRRNEIEALSGLTFDPFKGRIMIHRNTIEALNTPEYFRFLFNPKRKRFAVQACLMGEEGAEKLPALREGNCCYVNSLSLVKYVFRTCNWDLEYTHRVEGILYREQKLVEFDLSHSWELRWEEVQIAEQKGNDDAD